LSGLSFWICVVILLSFVFVFFVILLSFCCHLFVILLSFWERENEKKCLKHDYHDRPFVTSWQHQIEGTSAETLGKPAGEEG